MSNRIAVFNDGVVQQLATPDQLYETPENAFVAQFIGENNKLRGRMLRHEDGYCRVALASGEEVVALPVNAEPGHETLLSLRPERVAVDVERGSLANVFEAQVRELIYHGDHIRTRVAVCGHDEFIVKIPNAVGHVQLQPGQVTTVGWRPEDCRALDAA
jgi:putative spermidine/putrescine transport system ATP-binding protein